VTHLPPSVAADCARLAVFSNCSRMRTALRTCVRPRAASGHSPAGIFRRRCSRIRLIDSESVMYATLVMVVGDSGSGKSTLVKAGRNADARGSGKLQGPVHEQYATVSVMKPTTRISPPQRGQTRG